MIRGLLLLSVVAGVAAFGAAGAVLAAIGLGLSFIEAGCVMAALVAIVVYGAGRVLADMADDAPAPGPTLEERIRAIEEGTMHLRHDLRGVLSPAMMMTDRLLKNEDPAVRRAGQAVVRSIERATALLAENKARTEDAAQGGAAATSAGAAAAGTPRQSHAAGNAERSP